MIDYIPRDKSRGTLVPICTYDLTFFKCLRENIQHQPARQDVPLRCSIFTVLSVYLCINSILIILMVIPWSLVSFSGEAHSSVQFNMILLGIALLHLCYCVGIYCKLIPDWIKLTPARILFPAQYRIKLEIILGEVFLKYHRVIRQPASIYLDSLIVTESWVFIPRVFPRP